MKKVISWIVTLSMLLSLLALTGYAASGTGGDGVVWEIDDAGKLTISGKGPMEDHTPAGAGWGSWIAKNIQFGNNNYNYDSNDIYAIEVKGTLSRIGNSAFAYCRKNLDAVIHDGVQVIGRWAFLANEQLETVFIPTSVTDIGPMAFYQCDSLTDVYYGGTESQWKAIAIDSDNESLTGANIHYNSEPGVKPVYNTPFTDVLGGVYYEEGVIWAVEKGVTTGMTPTTFEPYTTCTRAHVVTFLWRAAGEPEPKSGSNPFGDVSKDQYCYKAVLWAAENEITNGTSENAFSPDDNCTRGQVATFLWRMLNEPEATTSSNPFRDVQADAFYYDAVLWAVENGVTKGVSTNLFAPDNTCTRGEAVTFLYRALG